MVGHDGRQNIENEGEGVTKDFQISGVSNTGLIVVPFTEID